MDKIQKMVGKTPISIDVFSDEEIKFVFSDGSICKFGHIQDCCESVFVKDISGDWDDLLNTPIIVAEERIEDYSEKDYSPRHDDSCTATFYTFRSIKGTVDVQWLGESNGYYSENVDIFWYDQPKPAGGE